MKILRNFLIQSATNYLIIGILILSIGCNSKNPVQTQDEAEDTTMSVKSTAFNIPITQSEYSVVKGSREFSYTVEFNNSNYTPTFIDPTISVPEFRRYLAENNADDSFDSLRVYPGLKNNKIILILCLGKGNTTTEKAYMILENTYYFANNSLPLIDDVVRFTECDQLHQNYLTSVKIYGKNQILNLPPAVDTIRYSRYYSLKQINKLIADNIKPDNLNESEISLKFESGYVDTYMAGKLQGRIGIHAVDQHQGFTCLVGVIDKNGNPIVDPTRPYRSNNDFEKLYLEVGSPCPPACGVLHPN